MKQFKRFLAVVIMATFIFGVVAENPVSASEVSGPREQIKQTIDRVQEVLRDKRIFEAEKKLKVRSIAKHRFDSEEMSKRVLGEYAQKYAGRMSEFVPLFTALLEKVYLDRILEAKNAVFVYGKETISDDTAIVETKALLPNGTEIDIHYRMHLVGREWKIYDVSVEGIGLISNYRTQFTRIIFKRSFDQLLIDIRKTVDGTKDK